jgi:hypothetical protein
LKGILEMHPSVVASTFPAPHTASMNLSLAKRRSSVLVIEDESRDRRAREADFLEADGSASASPETERRLLIDALWGKSPPPSAPRLLQIFVSQLRKTQPPAARVQTRGAGYALELERGSSVDATRFAKVC